MVLSCSSIISVTSLSITEGLAPVMVVDTETMGKSMFGILSIPILVMEITPKTMSAISPIRTVTGLLRAVFVSFIGYPSLSVPLQEERSQNQS